MRDGIRAADDGLGLAAAGKLKEAQDQLSQAQKLWPANHDLAKLTSKLDQLAKAEAEEAARQKSQPSASPSPKK